MTKGLADQTEINKIYEAFRDNCASWNVWTHVFLNQLHRKKPKKCSNLWCSVISREQSNLKNFYSRSSLSIFLNEEAAIFERESIAVGLHDSWKYLLFFWCILVTSIHETIFFSWVAMKITVKHQLSLLLHSLYHLFGMVNCRMSLFDWIYPLSIQVHQTQIASVVTNNNSVRIQHRYNFEDKVLP